MAVLDGNVKILGKDVSKKSLAIGGAAFAVVAVIIIRRRNAQTAATGTSAAAGTAAATGGTGTDPAGNTGPIDPATGYVYGSPEDLSASGTSGAGYAYGSGSGIDPNTGVPYAYEFGAGGGAPITNAPVSTPITTREEWIQAAENDLNAPNFGSVAAKVFAGIAVSSADKDLFLEGVALENAPPGGYPTPIKLTDTKGHPGQNGPGPEAEITVPALAGDHEISAEAKLRAKGLHARFLPNRPHPGHAAIVTSTEPAAGVRVDKGSTVTVNLRIT